jgi:hypothetical protein
VVPIPGGRQASDHVTMTSPFSTHPGLPRAVAGGDHAEEVLWPDAGLLACQARRLAEVARAIRGERGRARAADELGRVFADIDNAIAELAIAAELTADAVIEADRPSGTRATEAPPTPGARAVSWRLHGLAGALRLSREVCGVVQTAVTQLDDIPTSRPAAQRGDRRSAARRP